MAIRNLIARGIGFAPGAVLFVVTGGLSIGAAVVTGPGRTFAVAAEARRFVVEAEARHFSVAAESRIFKVE